MKKIFLTFIVAFTVASFSQSIYAAANSDVELAKAHINMNDKESLRNGARLFVNFCLSCHSAQYSRFNRVREDLEFDMTDADFAQTMMFTTEKEGDLMVTTMPEEDAKRWFGVAPPDLSLSARVHKPDWLYTYLLSFYIDENSPSGWNNSLFKNVAMPHVLYELQGVQRLVGKVEAPKGTLANSDINHAADDMTIVGNTIFELEHPGALTPVEFEKQMLDLTAFLTYLAEPAQLKRHTIGSIVIAFLILLTFLFYLLKKEYWRDVH